MQTRNPGANNAIVDPFQRFALVEEFPGKSAVKVLSERQDFSQGIIPHNHHFSIAWTLDHDHTFFHTQHQQYEPQLTRKSLPNPSPKKGHSR
jgi:hypothetical protein